MAARSFERQTEFRSIRRKLFPQCARAFPNSQRCGVFQDAGRAAGMLAAVQLILFQSCMEIYRAWREGDAGNRSLFKSGGKCSEILSCPHGVREPAARGFFPASWNMLQTVGSYVGNKSRANRLKPVLLFSWLDYWKNSGGSGVPWYSRASGG